MANHILGDRSLEMEMPSFASSRRALKAEMRARTNDEIMQACCRQTGN